MAGLLLPQALAVTPSPHVQPAMSDGCEMLLYRATAAAGADINNADMYPERQSASPFRDSRDSPRASQLGA